MRATAAFLLVAAIAAYGGEDPDWVVWQRKLDGAAEMQVEEALPLYGAALRHPEPFVRRRALRALAALASESTVAADTLREALFTEDQEQMREVQLAAEVLPDAADWFAEVADVVARERGATGTTEAAWFARGRVVEALALSGEPDAVARIEEAWGDESPFVRHKVSIALACLGPEGAAALERGLASESPNVQTRCLREIARKRTPPTSESLPALAALVETGRASQATSALAQLLRVAGVPHPLLLELYAKVDLPARRLILAALVNRAAEEPAVYALYRAETMSEDRLLAATALRGVDSIPTHDDRGIDEILAGLRANPRTLMSAVWHLRRRASAATLAELLARDDVHIIQAALRATLEIPADLEGARRLLPGPLKNLLTRPEGHLLPLIAQSLLRFEGLPALDAILAAAAPRIATREEIWWRPVFATLGEEAVDPLIAAVAKQDEVTVAAAFALAYMEVPRDRAVAPLVAASRGGNLRIGYTLVTMGDAAIPPLMEVFASNERQDRWAASVLMRMPGSAAAMLVASGGYPADVRGRLTAVLRRCGGWEELRQLARDADPAVRRLALTALTDKAYPGNADLWIAALEDSAPEVRRAAVEGMGLRGDASHLPLLLTRLGDSDPMVLGAACSALVRIGPEGQAAVRAYWPARGQQERTRTQILQTLAACGEEGWERIEQALKEDDREVRIMAVRLLGGAKRGVDALRMALQDADESVVFEAAGALISQDANEVALARLMELLRAEQLHTQRRAAAALRLVPEEAARSLAAVRGEKWLSRERELLGWLDFDAVGPLLDALEAGDASMRLRAIRGLSLLGPSAERAVPALAASLADPSDVLVTAAIEALGSIGRGAAPASEALLACAKREAFAADVRRALERIRG